MNATFMTEAWTSHLSRFGVTEMSRVIDSCSLLAVAQQPYSISRNNIAPALARKCEFPEVAQTCPWIMIISTI